MAVVIEVVGSDEPAANDIDGGAQVVEVVKTTDSPSDITVEAAVVEVAEPAGTVVNIQYGPDWPANPYEGQLFIKLV